MSLNRFFVKFNNTTKYALCDLVNVVENIHVVHKNNRNLTDGESTDNFILKLHMSNEVTRN